MGSISERLLLLVKNHAKGKPTVFAKLAGIPTSTFQYYINGRMPHGDHLIRICDIFSVNLNWLLTGKGDPYLSEIRTGNNGGQKHSKSPGQKVDTIVIQPEELLQSFSDQQRAISINRELIDLEKLDPEEFKRIETYIKATVDALESVVKKKINDRRKIKRRKQNITGDYSGENDRRSGMGRREDDQRGEDQVVNG